MLLPLLLLILAQQQKPVRPKPVEPAPPHQPPAGPDLRVAPSGPVEVVTPVTPVPTPEERAAARIDEPDVYAPAAGAVEAPTQPSRASSSLVLRGPRFEPGSAAGAEGRVLVRVKDMVSLRGQEENVVQGIGLVTGLAGTGDSANDARLRLLSLLKTQNINVTLQDIDSSNVAVVWVETSLPAGIKPGRKVDVRVSSLYDCESLVGGVLLHTELLDMAGAQVFATAAGPVSTGAFLAAGDGAAAVRNHLTVGTISGGGKVEREVCGELVTDHGYLYLDLKALAGSFGNAKRITSAVNEIYPGAADARDAMTVAVRVPEDLPPSSYVAYISSIFEREIEPEELARVVVNERTGVIVMGEGVRITRGAITKGNLTVTIAETPEVSQPGAFSRGETVEVPRTDVLVEEEDRPLSIVNGAITLREVVEVLNVLGVTPRDMIQILQSMAQSGMLHAEIVLQ